MEKGTRNTQKLESIIVKLDSCVPKEGAQLALQYKETESQRENGSQTGILYRGTILGTPTGFMRYGIELCRAALHKETDVPFSIDTEYLHFPEYKKVIETIKIDTSLPLPREPESMNWKVRLGCAIALLVAIITVLGMIRGCSPSV